MKLACSSTAFDRQLRNGDLTQLEWIELCARELAADGVVFDVAHFPRTDSDYLAQTKKMCADLGLTVAALRDDAFFGGDEGRMSQTMEQAMALGAPLLASQLEAETAASWSEVLERLGMATSLAKRSNVTLAVRNVTQTFAASTHDLKRVSKEADSAWLRYGPDFAAFDSADEPEALLAGTVLAWYCGGPGNTPVRVRALLRDFRGFLAVDQTAAGPNPTEAFGLLRV
ncbi:MAG TPA: TIM barrel protein [Candidatus Baltobacteraceae bacterium]|jgi:sugar phosphate isomerase/epimerase